MARLVLRNPEVEGEPARLAFWLGLLRCGGLGLQRVLGCLDQARKSGFGADREVAEGLAVERNVRGVEALDEAAVRDAVRTEGRVEAHDPETAEFTLLLLAIAVGVLPRVLDGFLRVAKELRFAAEIALGVFQRLFVPLAGSG